MHKNGSGQDVFKFHGWVRVTLARPEPRRMTQALKQPDLCFVFSQKQQWCCGQLQSP